MTESDDIDMLADDGWRMCEYCGEKPAVAEVDDSDPSVGYYSTLEVCSDCLHGAKR
ncbi:MAG: hypothetical protein ACM3S5_18850 [Rhodospirillales bacterium]